VTRSFLGACAMLLATLPAKGIRAEPQASVPSAPAMAAPTSAQCARAYEEAQEQRKSGQLSAARDNLRVCARDECPDFIHTDCSTWHGEVQGELPTLVLSATSGGRDLQEVTVSTKDKLLALRLEGQVIELDPGQYDLRFSASGMKPQLLRFVVARGERNRLVRVELVPLTATVPPEPTDTPSSPPTAPLDAPPGRSLTAPAVLTGVGLVGLGGFVALGAWGRSSESQLAERCAPRCESEQVADTRSKYVLADVSLGVGVVSLALAAYTFFTSGPPDTTGARGVAVQAGARDLRMTYGGSF
jgi:hypothetical protein